VNSVVQGFESTFGSQLTTGRVVNFDAAQFHWHSGSEHTVNDDRMDFEMHTVHLPRAGSENSEYMAAALGVMFDRKYWNKSAVTDEQIVIIDTFFDSLFAGMSTSLTLAPSYIT